MKKPVPFSDKGKQVPKSHNTCERAWWVPLPRRIHFKGWYGKIVRLLKSANNPASQSLIFIRPDAWANLCIRRLLGQASSHRKNAPSIAGPAIGRTNLWDRENSWEIVESQKKTTVYDIRFYLKEKTLWIPVFFRLFTVSEKISILFSGLNR